MEGTTSKVLNAGIGHIEETAGIGESGNCVLCGHNGSRLEVKAQVKWNTGRKETVKQRVVVKCA